MSIKLNDGTQRKLSKGSLPCHSIERSMNLCFWNSISSSTEVPPLSFLGLVQRPLQNANVPWRSHFKYLRPRIIAFFS